MIRPPSERCSILKLPKSLGIWTGSLDRSAEGAASRKQPAVPAHTSFFYTKVIGFHYTLSISLRMALPDGSG